MNLFTATLVSLASAYPKSFYDLVNSTNGTDVCFNKGQDYRLTNLSTSWTEWIPDLAGRYCQKNNFTGFTGKFLVKLNSDYNTTGQLEDDEIVDLLKTAGYNPVKSRKLHGQISCDCPKGNNSVQGAYRYAILSGNVESPTYESKIRYDCTPDWDVVSSFKVLIDPSIMASYDETAQYKCYAE